MSTGMKANESIETAPVAGELDDTVRSAVERFRRLLEREYEVEDIIVFGSQARGTAGPDSDTDVAVILRGEPKRFLPVKLAMSALSYDIFLDTDVNISPLPIWLGEWNDPANYSTPALLHSVATEGVRL